MQRLLWPHPPPPPPGPLVSLPEFCFAKGIRADFQGGPREWGTDCVRLPRSEAEFVAGRVAGRPSPLAQFKPLGAACSFAPDHRPASAAAAALVALAFSAVFLTRQRIISFSFGGGGGKGENAAGSGERASEGRGSDD